MNHTLLRSVFKIGAGMLASKGIIQEHETELVAGAVVGVLSVVWGFFARKKPEPVKLPPITKPPLMILAGLLCLSLVGCSTMNSPQDSIPKLVKIVAFNGTFAALTDEPQFRADFIEARDRLAELEKQPEVDWLDVMLVLQRLPIKELRSDETRLIIGNLSLILSDFGNSADLTNENARSIVKAFRQGITAAL